MVPFSFGCNMRYYGGIVCKLHTVGIGVELLVLVESVVIDYLAVKVI